jgi:hypothetical protein
MFQIWHFPTISIVSIKSCRQGEISLLINFPWLMSSTVPVLIIDILTRDDFDELRLEVLILLHFLKRRFRLLFSHDALRARLNRIAIELARSENEVDGDRGIGPHIARQWCAGEAETSPQELKDSPPQTPCTTPYRLSVSEPPRNPATEIPARDCLPPVR